MTPLVNTQRGVPYDPQEAIAQRERRASQAVQEQARSLREQARQAKAQAKREYGRFLDQVEACYRERARDRRFSS